MTWASVAGSRSFGDPDPAQSAVRLRRQGFPFVREIRRRHGIGNAMGASGGRGRAARPAPRPDLPAAMPIRSSKSLRWNCRMGGFRAVVLVRPKRLPLLIREAVGKPQARQHDHAARPSGRLAPATAATAGAAVVMPAATVKPGGGSAFQRSANCRSIRLRRSARSIAPLGRAKLRAKRRDQLQLFERFLPVRGQGRWPRRPPRASRAGSISSANSASSVRARSPASRRLPPTPRRVATIERQPQQVAPVGSIAGGDRS